MFLVGGSPPRNSGPDISLGLCSWSLSGRPCLPSRGNGPNESIPTENTVDEEAATVTVLANTGACQEGDVPSARIGHSAIADLSRSTIILFAGESLIPSTNGSYPKLSDVYEGTPKEPSGALVWRALIDSKVANAEGSNLQAPDTPAPMAFHATCAACVRGERAMLVHGGMDEGMELLGDIWAFFLTTELGDGDHGKDGDTTGFSWERLVPEGAG